MIHKKVKSQSNSDDCGVFGKHLLQILVTNFRHQHYCGTGNKLVNMVINLVNMDMILETLESLGNMDVSLESSKL